VKGNFRIFNAARWPIAWFAVLVVVFSAALLTSFFGVPIRIQAFGNVRLVAISELASFVVFFTGLLTLSPRLESWELTSTRPLWQYQLINGIALIIVSSAVNLIWPFGRAWESVKLITIDPREAWQAEALHAMMPYAVGMVITQSVLLMIYSLLDRYIGLVASICAIPTFWYLHLSPLGVIVPLPGAIRDDTMGTLVQPPIYQMVILAISVIPIGLFFWSRRRRKSRHNYR
jgi:hypothetical protein